MFVMHAFPVLLHACMYGKMQIVIEIVTGILSFLFYIPAYLIILNIYALCRIDDISWGTKGRDQEQNFKQTLKLKCRPDELGKAASHRNTVTLNGDGA